MNKVGQVVVIKTKEEIEKSDIICIPKTIKKYMGKEMYINNIIVDEYGDNKYSLETPNGNIVKYNKDEPFYFCEYYISNNKPKIYKEIKVGDVIKFGIIKEYKKYGNIIASRYISSFSNNVCTISNIDKDGTFQISEDTKNYWYSRTMINKYQNNSDLNIGDEVYVYPTNKEDEKYKGEKAEIRFIEYSDIVNDYAYVLDIDGGQRYWSKEELIKKGNKKLFDLDKIRDTKIVICCNNEIEVEQLFNVFNSIDIKWCDGDNLNASEFLSNCDCTEIGFEINLYNKLEYGYMEWFQNRKYNVINFEDIIFDFLKEEKDKFNPDKSKTINRKYLTENRGLCIGDIYKLEDEEQTQHNGWRIAMNGYSIGLNCDNTQSWGTLESEEKMKITKLIPFDKSVYSYSNMSEFMKTFDESIISNMIVKVV